MRWLILGCGHLGTAFARRAQSAGTTDIHGTTTSEGRFSALERAGVRPRLWKSGMDLAPLLETRNAVLLSVAAGRGGRASLYPEVTMALASTLRDAGPPFPRVLYTSSTGIYGEEAGAWVDEETPPAPTSPRGKQMLAAEEALFSIPEDRRSIVRLAGLDGPARGARMLAPSMAGTEQDGGDRWLNLIAHEDVVELLWSLRESGPSLLCASDGRPRRRAEFYSSVLSALGLPPAKFRPGGKGLGRRVNNARMLTFFGCELRALEPWSLR